MADGDHGSYPGWDQIRHEQQYTHIVVIFREQEPTIVGFHNLKDAMRFADEAGAQWSETYVTQVYVTQVIKGPKA